jgi:orotidine-5'-phosphate decarboxylase
MINLKDKLILALDTPNIDDAIIYAKKFKNHITAIKLGLEFFISCGPQGIMKVSQLNIPIFLDLKLHDIPNTVECAVREAVKLDIFMLTLHCAGGKEMLKRAVNIARETANKYNVTNTNILGVTILTSLDQTDLSDIGYSQDLEKNVLNLATIAKSSGLDGIVCSAHEISLIKKNFGNDLKIITPGIRFPQDTSSDQKRIMSPKQAIQLGSDYLVMGRSLTKYDNIEDINKLANI